MLPLLLAPLALLQTPAAVPAQAIAPKYVQSLTAKDGTIQMQTSAARFTATGKPDIWLVGAVHIGTTPYYLSLQKLLDEQGEVLYEGVTSGAPKPDPKVAPAAAPTAVYKTLSDALGLEFQQVHIQYNRPNWKNCDLSWADLDRLNKAAAGGKPSGFDGVKSLLDPNGGMGKMLTGFLGTATPGTKEAIKIMLVKSSASEGSPMLDAATSKIILEERNKHVIDALATEIAGPSAPKSIGILYGAAHLPGIEQALTAKYGYQVSERRWFTSASADPKKVDATGQMMLDAIEAQLKAAKPKGG